MQTPPPQKKKQTNKKTPPNQPNKKSVVLLVWIEQPYEACICRYLHIFSVFGPTRPFTGGSPLTYKQLIHTSKLSLAFHSKTYQFRNQSFMQTTASFRFHLTARNLCQQLLKSQSLKFGCQTVGTLINERFHEEMSFICHL